VSEPATDHTGEEADERNDDVKRDGKDSENMAGSRDSEGESLTTETVDGQEVDVANIISPLAEYYDAFRSLGIIHQALNDSAESPIPESDPLQLWISDVQSIISEAGYGDQESGYGKQQSIRCPFSMSEYREGHGTPQHVTEFEVVDVCPPSKAVMALLNDSLLGLSSWVVPIAPQSRVPLPVVVESEAELRRARSLLDEFPSKPAVDINSPDGESTENRGAVSSTPRGEIESEDVDMQESSSTPVEDVRGVSSSIAVLLRDAGYEQLSDLQVATDEELESIEGVSSQRVQLIRAAVGFS
jgi:hypothetical protein